MRIGILTLRSNSNYGNILQAYALQRLLKEMGHNVHFIGSEQVRKRRESVYLNFKLNPILAPLVYMKRAYRKYVKGERISVFYVKNIRSSYLNKVQYLESFIKENLEYHNYNDFNEIEPNTYDMIVVGSDQIWRVENAKDILNSFLCFAQDWNIKRVAYSASFGIDSLEGYSSAEVVKCAELAKLFNAISVREDSGVVLCRECLGVEAEHLLDPTMLLEEQDYRNMITEIPIKENILTKYFLSNNSGIKNLENKITARLALEPYSTRDEEIVLGSLNNEDNKLISPLKWLAAFRDAKFVITDSYHGTLFSIIFNKPFVVLIDATKNTARFKSILKILGLEDRLIYKSSELLDKHFEAIDWQRVNKIKKEWQEKSFKFLKHNLK